jgi:hypothetical protein
VALQKIPVPINFVGGYGQKTDPKQLAIGKFQSLKNTTFNKVGLLQKRNGFAELTNLSATNLSSVTTYSQSLVALGSTLNVFSEDQNEWLNRGNINQVSLSTLPVVRSSTNQSSVDASLSSTGLSLEVWADSDGTCKYQVNDSSNGQILLSPVNLPSGAHIPRAFALDNYFIVTYLITVSGTPKLEYIAIPVNNLTNPGSPVVISSVVKSNTAGYDGTVVLDTLYLAWNGSDGGGAIHYTSINQFLSVSSIKSIAGHNGDLISIVTDPLGINTWITYWDSSSGNGYTSIFNNHGVAILSPTKTISAITINELTSQLLNNVLNIIYAVTNYYPSGVRSDYSQYNTVTQSGTVGTATVILRSVGLASKAFIQNNTVYCMFVYGGAFQPTYFVSDLLGNIQVKLAYSNGGGYLTTQVLSNVTFTSSGNPYIAYQYKDLLVSVNKVNNVSNNNSNIYTQAGVNIVTFNFNSPAYAVEIGNNLNLSGGVFTSYDGNKPVEQEFHLWPEDITFLSFNTGGAMSDQDYFYKTCYEWTDAQGNLFRSAPSIPQDVTVTVGSDTTFTSVFAINVSYLTISSSSGLIVGQTITDTTTAGNIQPGTYITSIASGASTTTTSVFASGVTSITLLSSTGFTVGQTITDSTTGSNITAGTIITSISGNVIGLSQPTAGASASSPGDTLAVSSGPVIGISLPTVAASAGGGDTLQTTNFGSVQLVIPTLRLTAKFNVRIVIYRWSTANQSYYQITSISSPLLNNPAVDTVTYLDTINDNLIVGNELLYTTGGVVENIAPPSTQIMTLYKSRLILLDAEDTNLLWYSKQVIENTPVEMSDFFTIYVAPTIGANKSTGPITALGAMDDKLIVFKKDAIYYILGSGPDNTGANDDFSDPIFIAGTVGSTNQQSIGLIPSGLMFQSDKGIWLLDRNLGTSYIGKDVEDFTANATVLSSVLIPETNQIRFTLSSGVTLMYDYFVQQWGSFVNIPGISSVIYNGLHTYLRSDGAVFQETPGEYLDGSSPTLISFTTSWFNIAGLQGYQRAYQYYLLGTYISPHFLQVQTAYDYQSYPTQSDIIQPDNYSTPWGGDPQWGESSEWGGASNSEQWRVNLQQQKCQSVQITVNEIFDSSFGTVAGAGLTLSGINLIMGAKSGYPRLAPSRAVG